MSPSRGGRRKTLLLAIATVTILHLIVWRSTSSLRSLHTQQLTLFKRGKHSQQEHEPSTDALIDWLNIYKHSSREHRPFVFFVMLIWLIFLFAFVGICASEFFCPNLSHIASRLGLSESVAGVTFLAFSNGSPDVFSTFSALKSNAGSLAIGELIGAASFIVSVVAGTMALITPFRVSRHTFLRDVGFFTLAVLMTLAILYDSHIHLWEALMMVGLYAVYVVYVGVGGWWWSRRGEKRRKLRMAREEYDSNAVAHEEEALILDEDGEDERAGIAGGAEIEWERPIEEEDEEEEDDLIELPVSGSTTPRSTTGRSISSSFSTDSIIFHSQSQSQSRPSRSREPPILSSPRLPRPHSHHSHSHSHYRSRSTSLINPTTFQPPLGGPSRPPPTPLSLQNSISSLPSQSPVIVASTSISTSAVPSTASRKTARPSLLGAIEFRDLVNSLNAERGNAGNLLGVFERKSPGSGSGGGGGKGKRAKKERRPNHSRTTSTASSTGWTSPSPSPSPSPGAGMGPEEEEGQEEWNWNGWGNSSQPQFGGAETSSSSRRRASSSPGFRPDFFASASGREGGLRLGGEEDTLANGILQKKGRKPSISESVEEEEDESEENPWAGQQQQQQQQKKEVKKVPSIMLTSETGSDTLLPSTPTASTSSLTVRPSTSSSPLSASHLPPSSSPPLATKSRWNDHNRSILFRAILSSLFPSLDQFGSKSIIGKITAVMCVPALLLLNLTLPVAEEVSEGDESCGIGAGYEEKEDEEREEGEDLVPKGIRLPEESDGTLISTGTQEEREGMDDHGESSERVGKKLHSPAVAHPHSHHLSSSSTTSPSLSAPAATLIAIAVEEEEEEVAVSPWIDQTSSNSTSPTIQPLDGGGFRTTSPESNGTVTQLPRREEVDSIEEQEEEEGETESLILDRLECEAARKVTRGLTSVQCLLGPMFCAFALFADDLKWYQPVLALCIGLFFSTLAYRFFHNPRHPGRVSLCFLGFGIAMVWILMIVNEVVGVLQTLGHIFGISDAILGLTIFAMGNSLGDLVANATVARMGYPSMAIAACFGGPMLNILLGVGLSGTYLIALSPTHESIHVEMGRTLMVSGVGLFTILVGSLVIVPMNGYRMTKRIGGFLIAAYSVVLSINVVTEIWW